MKREFARLENGPFDLLVVGGGIYGAWAAYDAALRGLRVALVDKGDWAAATSSASSKLIHGGLRYLEYFEFSLVRKALHERKLLVERGPHRIYPLRFLIPVYRGDRVGRFRFSAGLTLYDLLAGRGQPVPRHQSFRARTMTRQWSFLSGQGLKGGFSYGDCGTDDARLTLEVVDGAWQAGAAAVNHARVVDWIRDGERISGAVIQDERNGRAVELRAAVVLNTAGPWAEELAGETPRIQRFTRLIKGVHLVMPALPCQDAFLLTARSDGRIFFLIPWYGRTLLGTTESEEQLDPEDVSVEDRDVDYLLDNANRVLDGIVWGEQDIRGRFAGLRTLRNQPGVRPSAVTREWSLEEPVPGMLLPVGGKLTSARADAAEAVDQVFARLDRPAPPCPTAVQPFPWRPRGAFEPWLAEATAAGERLGLDPSTAACAARRFGSRLDALHERLRGEPALVQRVHPELPFCRAELHHAVAQEMAVTPEDVLRRRVPASILAPLPDALRREVSALLEHGDGQLSRQVGV